MKVINQYAFVALSISLCFAARGFHLNKRDFSEQYVPVVLCILLNKMA